MATILRHQRLVYMHCEDDYELVGQGFTDLTVAANAKTAEKQYVHQQNASGGLTGYAPTLTFTSELDDSDPVSVYLQEIANQFDIGEKAHTSIVIVDTWKEGKTEGTKVARKQDVVISIDNPGSGAAGVELALTGTMTYNGNPIEGEFDMSAKTFTANA